MRDMNSIYFQQGYAKTKLLRINMIRLLHTPLPNSIYILIWTHIINNTKRRRRLLIPQYLKHLWTHSTYFTPRDCKELVLLGTEMAPGEEQTVHCTDGIWNGIVCAAVVSEGEED